jgi:hypothetical protein
MLISGLWDGQGKANIPFSDFHAVVRREAWDGALTTDYLQMPQIVIENRNIVLTVNVSINWSECPYSKVGNTGRKHRDMYAYMEVRVLLLSFKMHPLESYHA